MKFFKKPVYIGLGLFLAGILVAGFVNAVFVNNTEKVSESVKKKTEEFEHTEDFDAKENEVQQIIEASSSVSVEEEQTDVKKEEKEAEKKEFSLSAPVYGEIMTPHTGSELIFSKTMQDYRRHLGVDIRSSILEKVLSCEKGVVKEVKNDRLLGITIVIDHENGFESVYANLSTGDMVSVGDRVSKGVIISGVGDTAISETGEEAHLHFELFKDGKAVNPEDYIDF